MASIPRLHLYLIGYRGSGKSSVGRALARLLHWSFVDSDDEIERTAGKSIAQIFESEGESGFRDRESETIAAIQTDTPTVASLGGGAILRPANRELIASRGLSVWLIATPDQLARRIAGDTATQSRRPSLSQLGTLGEIENILKIREPLYRESSDFQIETEGKSVDQIAREIADWYAGLDRA